MKKIVYFAVGKLIFMPFKKYAAFLVLVLMSLTTRAQYFIPDSSFENWTTDTVYVNSSPVTYLNPVGWLTPDSVTLVNGGIAQVTQSDSAYLGTYAAQLTTQSVHSNAIPGFLLLGQFNLVQKNIYGGIPMFIPPTDKPDSLTGYYKFHHPYGLSDSFLMYIVFTHYNDTTNKRDTVGIGSFGDSLNMSNYTRFAFGINYDLIYKNETIDTIQMGIFSSGNFITAQVGTMLLVDNLAFDTTDIASAVYIVPHKNYNISCYPNPANDMLNIFIGQPQTGMMIKVYDVLGRNVLSENDEGLITPVTVSALCSGNYFFEVLDKYGNLLNTEKFSIVH